MRDFHIAQSFDRARSQWMLATSHTLGSLRQSMRYRAVLETAQRMRRLPQPAPFLGVIERNRQDRRRCVRPY